MSGYVLFGIGSCTLGVAFGLHATREIFRRRSVWRHAVHVQAVVIALEYTPTGDDGPDYYTPYVRFVDEEKVSHEVKLLITTDTRKYEVGRMVPILYQFSNPVNILNPDESISEIAAIGINLGLGATFLVIGLLSLFGQIRIS